MGGYILFGNFVVRICCDWFIKFKMKFLSWCVVGEFLGNCRFFLVCNVKCFVVIVLLI